MFNLTTLLNSRDETPFHITTYIYIASLGYHTSQNETPGHLFYYQIRYMKLIRLRIDAISRRLGKLSGGA